MGNIGDRRQHQNVSSHCHCMPRIHDTLFIYSNNNNAMQTLIVIDCQPKAAHAHSPRVPLTILAGIGWRAGDLCPFRAFLIGDRFCALAARFVGKIYELLSVGMSLSLLLFRSRRRDFLAIFTFNFSLLLMPL